MIGYNPAYIAQEESWLGASLDAISIFPDRTSWANIQNSITTLTNTLAGTGKDILWAMPLIPNGATLAAAANGDYDANYVAIATSLASR